MTDCTEIIINSPEPITYVLPSDPYVFIKGDQGEQGEQGDPGPPLLIKGNLNSVADLPLNPLAGDGYLINGILYTWTGTEWINGGQIQGPQGIQGLPGPANSLTIGTVSTGSPANATISGTSPNQILSLVIPQGIQGIQGIQGKNIELQTSATHIQWRLVGDLTWINLISLADITGPQGIQGINGKNIELQTSTTHIQWRLAGDSIWINLLPLADITGPQGIQGIQGIQGLPGLPPADSWHYLFLALTENDLRLEGASFPRSITLPPLLRQTTITQLAGLINTLSSGTAIISIQHGISSFTTITGLSTLACTTSVLADQTATANNIIPAGNRIRILFTSITGTLNLSFRLDISEAL